ncbi:MAG: coproporphyrinogen III oxidase, partial [Actinobacteria bacterium]|nr:coproporphyrinogen III oxidase [Actinomycetota bacterium]
MPSALPLGDAAPEDGVLPERALQALASRTFGVYVHVPFCRVRCGYCDFNTYTIPELGGYGATVDSYADAAVAELRFAAGVLAGAEVPAVRTVFVGG